MTQHTNTEFLKHDAVATLCLAIFMTPISTTALRIAAHVVVDSRGDLGIRVRDVWRIDGEVLLKEMGGRHCFDCVLLRG